MLPNLRQFSLRLTQTTLCQGWTNFSRYNGYQQSIILKARSNRLCTFMIKAYLFCCQNRCSTGAFVAIPSVHEWRAPTKRSARQNSAQGSFGPRLERSSNRKNSILSRIMNTTTTITTKRRRTKVAKPNSNEGE